MSKSNIRKIAVDPTKCNIDSRRPSVFERLGTKPAVNIAASTQNPADYCRNWAVTGSCSYGKSCKFANTHILISPSKRVKKDNASANPSLLIEDQFKRLTSKIVKATHSPDLNLEDWNQTDLEYEDEKVLERRRQLLQRELELQMKKDKEVHGKDKLKYKKKDMSSSSSSRSSSSSSSSTSSSSDDSSSSSTSDSNKKVKRFKKTKHSTSPDFDDDRDRKKKAKTPLPIASQLAPLKTKERLRSDSPIKSKPRDSEKDVRAPHKKIRLDDDLSKDLLPKKSLDHRLDGGRKETVLDRGVKDSKGRDDRSKARSRDRTTDRRSRTPAKYASSSASKTKRSPERMRPRGQDTRHQDRVTAGRSRDRDRDRERERDRDKAPREPDSRRAPIDKLELAGRGRSRDRRALDKEHRDSGHSRLPSKRDDDRRPISVKARSERERERDRDRERDKDRLLPSDKAPRHKDRLKDQTLGSLDKSRAKSRPVTSDKYDRDRGDRERDRRRYKDPERRDAVVASPRNYPVRNTDTWDEQEEPPHEYEARKLLPASRGRRDDPVKESWDAPPQVPHEAYPPSEWDERDWRSRQAMWDRESLPPAGGAAPDDAWSGQPRYDASLPLLPERKWDSQGPHMPRPPYRNDRIAKELEIISDHGKRRPYSTPERREELPSHAAKQALHNSMKDEPINKKLMELAEGRPRASREKSGERRSLLPVPKTDKAEPSPKETPPPPPEPKRIEEPLPVVVNHAESDLSDISDDPDDILNMEEEISVAENKNLPRKLADTDRDSASVKSQDLAHASPKALEDTVFKDKDSDAFSHKNIEEESMETMDFEEISDGELEEDVKTSCKGLGDALGVDWESLVKESQPRRSTNTSLESVHNRWQCKAVFQRIGISVKAAGTDYVEKLLKKYSNDESDPLLLNDVALIHTALKREQISQNTNLKTVLTDDILYRLKDKLDEEDVENLKPCSNMYEEVKTLLAQSA
ncbi:zinc finger CCCH domain-containing protein 13-like [Trichogramma pretiosum]|uniref:zinc finger CCCH domain-containing protein 13-like n=1 Tax=Trichogramma pretiosum TaxID=7493 RepID=UPI0006C9D368|nr:zinc finger CCCH domain-containing protein 13-like [Trichogramma pretiosum]